MRAQGQARPNRPELNASAPLILIVDDSPDDREIYSQFLESRGFRSVTAADGETALRLGRDRQPDVIVMDLSLPGLDGWGATRLLKNDRLTAHIPIIACTGHAFGAPVEQALDAGCDAYIVKPCLPDDLLNEIKRHLTRRDRPQRRRA
jgi:CheY-like chemotaxis protein